MKYESKISTVEQKIANRGGTKEYNRKVAITSVIRLEAHALLTQEEKEAEFYASCPTDKLKANCLKVFKEMEKEGINMQGVRMPAL